MNKLSKEITSMLKSNTYTSVYFNMLNKLPIVITNEGILIDKYKPNFIDDEAHRKLYYENKDEYFKEYHNFINNDANRLKMKDDTKIYNILSQETRLEVVEKFHYDDTWYHYRYSSENPEETFGIIRTYNLPFKSFTKFTNKKSFICRMDQMVMNDYINPFMLFVDGKFVSWSYIDIVYDGNDIYMLLHSDKYNYFYLKRSELSIVILPFTCEFIGDEDEDYLLWSKNYLMLEEYLQNSLHLNSDNKIEISVPTMDSIYFKNGMVYNVGAWMYAQIKAYNMGTLPSDKSDLLKNMTLNYYIYDDAGNVISTIPTRFNALDKDVYDEYVYNRIFSHDINYVLRDDVFKFRFDKNGSLSSNGKNMIVNLSEDMEVLQINTMESGKFVDLSKYDQHIFIKNFINFYYDGDGASIYTTHDLIRDNYDANNLFKIDTAKDIMSFVCLPKNSDSVLKISDFFPNQKYYLDTLRKCITTNTPNYYIKDTTTKLNFSNFTELPHADNEKKNYNTLLNFNHLLFKDNIDVYIESSTLTGKQVNESLETSLYGESRRGLKIPRLLYDDHETYVIIFLNGELIDAYSQMYVSPNYFFLPVDTLFDNGDVIELLFFTQCNNNEIHFKMTNGLLKYDTKGSDPKFITNKHFEKFIKSRDAKIFARYPSEILEYKDIINERNDIAFNISYRNSKSELLLFKDVADNVNNEYTIVSSRKFIYERIYVDQKAYRMKLGIKFRYCDNQKQYILFINGRRMQDDAFFITVPKYSRPFDDIYLYSNRFISPEDRVEIFYVPEELIDENVVKATFDQSGYIKTDVANIDVPLDNKSYLYFVNGKKIPSNDIVPINSNMCRVNKDTRSLLSFYVNPVYRNTDPDITRYIKNGASLYDSVVKRIYNKNVNELDALFNCRVKMSNIEQDKILWDVQRISIINEIVRDFWVSSGYPYNDKPFVYDYEIDEIITKDPKNGNYIIPAMDANPSINIPKNNIELLKFECNKGVGDKFIYELGRKISNIAFSWEFTEPVNNGSIVLASQYINGKELSTADREYTVQNPIDKHTEYHFEFNTGSDKIEQKVTFDFFNGVYYGVVDEDILQHYKQKNFFEVKDLIGIVPKNKVVPFLDEIINSDDSIESILKDNYIMENLESFTDTNREQSSTINIDDPDVIAVCDDGRIFRNIMFINDNKYSGEIIYRRDLYKLMNRLNREYQDDVSLDFNKYRIGSNNYFVYAVPKRLAYDVDGNFVIKFMMPDLNDRALIDYGKDDKTTPIYTNGEFDNKNCLIGLDKFEMVYMDEFKYTNPSGYEETYMIWKSNGFFTRKYDDYLFDMKIVDYRTFSDTEIPVLITENKKKSIRGVNTSSLNGESVNDNIIMMDTILI